MTKNTTSLESKEQERYFEWCKSMEQQYPELAFCHCSLSGIKLTPGAAVKAKRQGNKGGVPDIFLPVPKQGYHGLFIELKRRKGGIVSPIQKMWKNALNDFGYLADVCYGSDDAIILTKKYMGIE